VIERILRDRDGIWSQINEEHDLRRLTGQMLVNSVVSLAIFGLVLGSSNGVWQALSSMVKLPLLFLATLAICLPTLYLFNLVFGARLSMAQAVTLIMVPVTVIAVLTLAFAPISLFFLITAQSYAFFKLLNVCILVLTALIGLRFLTAGMAALNAHHEATVAPAAAFPAPPLPLMPPVAPVAAPPLPLMPPVAPVAAPGQRELALVGAVSGTTDPVTTTARGGDGNGVASAPANDAVAAPAPPATTSPPATAPLAPAATQRPASMTLVRIWILLFGFVGTQLAWTLRPFFGDPDAPFALFREISGTFYSDILRTIGQLFS
jgi:hypothetical protein